MSRSVKTDLARSTGLRSKEDPGHRRCVFLDFSLYRTFGLAEEQISGFAVYP
jgi:hypothetical protein